MKMKLVWSLTIVFFVIMWGVDPKSQPQSSLHDQPEFPDHYILAVQYSLSICIVKKCGQTTRRNLPTAFSIHGLWPKNKDESEPPIREKEEFNITKLGSKLKEDLSKYWFDVYKYDKPQLYYTFWEHEWDDHGKKSILGLEDYYFTTVRLHEKFVGVFESLVQKNKYVPGILFSLKQFGNSFAANLGVPWITCAKLGNGTIVVTEMRFRIEPIGSGEFKPHPNSKIDTLCTKGVGGLAMLPSTEGVGGLAMLPSTEGP